MRLLSFSKLAIVMILVGASYSSFAYVYTSPEAAIRNRFPKVEKIKKKTILLTELEMAALQKRIGIKIDSKLFRFYIAYKGGSALSYSGLYTRRVRTKDMTLLFSFGPKGELQDIEIIAFYEPPEYKPSQMWLSQFKGVGFGNHLKIKKEIIPITGATLSARTVTDLIPLIKAVWQKEWGKKDSLE